MEPLKKTFIYPKFIIDIHNSNRFFIQINRYSDITVSFALIFDFVLI